MKRYFGYIRVSTVRQGQKGSSLVEQKSAIQAYAQRNGLTIDQWFEEQETAASSGRPIFNTMFKALERGDASGVVTHKIDRSARNLKDWADLGELIDRGIEMHFAHEAIDLTSRGGRLSADIQAVVAADYIRNLRQEVRKGFYGRLKQGLYPLAAPIGYLNEGGGKAKSIDPIRGPLIARAFSLYATGTWTFETLGPELYELGLRGNVSGRRVTRNGLSTIFNNSFYIGLIHLRKTGETFQGIHEPLIDKRLYDRVQLVLQGRLAHKVITHRFRYQRLLRCTSCSYSLIGERQKGRVYYRCHTKACALSVREDRLNEMMGEALAQFRMTDTDWNDLVTEVENQLDAAPASADDMRRGLVLGLAATEERLARLTDAYLDQVLDKEAYEARKEQLLHERASFRSRLDGLDVAPDVARRKAGNILELLKGLGCLADTATDAEVREVLKDTTSNVSITPNELVIAWQDPFRQLCFGCPVPTSALERIKPRTFDLAATIVKYACAEHGDMDTLKLLEAKAKPPVSADNNIIRFNRERKRQYEDRDELPGDAEMQAA